MSWHSLRDCFGPSAFPPDPQRRAVALLRQAWGSLAGPLPPGGVAPRRLSREGVLTLVVGDQPTASRVRAERGEMLKRLQAFLGPQVVTGLRWEIGPCPPPLPSPPQPRPPSPVPEAERAAAAITDPALRERFMAACRALGGGPVRG